MKLTKVIATVGPACESPAVIRRMIDAGVNVFRFNLKHNTLRWHEEKIKLVNTIAKKMEKTIGVMIDLQGPEIRMKLPTDSVNLLPGQKWRLPQKASLESDMITFSHPFIIDHLVDGDKVLVDDGQFEFVVKKEGNNPYLISRSKGILKNSKSVVIPYLKIDLPLFTQKDLDAIELATREKIDFIALSFVRTDKDINTLKNVLRKKKINAKIVAKIETAQAVKNLTKIIEATDAIMVARGDLGVEMPLVQVGFWQKEIIRQAKARMKPVIVATQMLESMIENPFPTRAEISDITNAFYDGADATMLSQETAAGKFPLAAINYMSQTLTVVEKEFSDFEKEFPKIENNKSSQEISVINAAYVLWNQLRRNANFNKIAFLVFTKTGRTGEILSSLRPNSPIIAILPEEKPTRFLSLNFGVFPFYDKDVLSGRVTHEMIDKKIEFLKKNKILKKGLTLIVLHGDIWGKVGGISTIRVVKI